MIFLMPVRSQPAPVSPSLTHPAVRVFCQLAGASPWATCAHVACYRRCKAS